jgi:thiamine biosynthesis lipoprotein
MNSSSSWAQFPALGSTALVAVSDPDGLERARSTVERVVWDFDLACSRFREDSELTALNAASGSELEVSPLLLESVQTALRAASLTDGDVDPTVGEALIALGYDRDFDAITAGAPVQVSVVSVPGWRTVHVDDDRSTIRTGTGVTLDLGATAKAQAADRAAADARANAGCGVLVGLGGDFAIAGPPPSSGWRIHVTDDHRSGLDAPGQWITLRSGGLATSSTTVRRWGESHHLLDPSTGQPAHGPWRTASVAAASCVDANIASTAAIVRGERAIEWLEARNLPSRLVAQEGAVRHVAGWPAEGDDLR